MNLKAKFSTYNQGVLYISETSTTSSSFSAPVNPTAETDITKIQKLDFNRMEIREQDTDFAEAKERTLTLKVKTRYHESATTDRQVLIGKDLYDIFKVDPDADNTNMYLFLEKVRTLT